MLSEATSGLNCNAGSRLLVHAKVYDAYVEGKRFADGEPPDGKKRYAPLRGSLPDALAAAAGRGRLSLAELQKAVHTFVIHYDVAGTSRQSSEPGLKRLRTWNAPQIVRSQSRLKCAAWSCATRRQ
jgi:hypothetical protein